MSAGSLNAVYSRPSMRRRYEVWFLRLMLADGSGAWWFRYLLMNLGRSGGGGCPGNPGGQPVQMWATWFPRGEEPLTLIQGFPQEELSLSAAGADPFHLRLKENGIDEDSCAGRLEVDGHRLRWDLRYHSTLGVTLSDLGWIGFSRTPHSDAVFSGTLTLDGKTFRSEPLGYGVQGHNCGYRHRHRWSWTHCAIPRTDGVSVSTFEAVEYEILFGMRFRTALLWHDGALYTFRKLEEISRDANDLQWTLRCSNRSTGAVLTAQIDGSGPSLHRLPYLKTDCAGSFEVANNSLAQARLSLSRPGQPPEEFGTDGGAALEMVGG